MEAEPEILKPEDQSRVLDLDEMELPIHPGLIVGIGVLILFVAANLYLPHVFWEEEPTGSFRWSYRMQWPWTPLVDWYEDIKQYLAFIALGGFLAQILGIAFVFAWNQRRQDGNFLQQIFYQFVSYRFAAASLACFVVACALGMGLQAADQGPLVPGDCLPGVACVLTVFLLACLGLVPLRCVLRQKLMFIDSKQRLAGRMRSLQANSTIMQLIVLTLLAGIALAITRSGTPVALAQLEIADIFAPLATASRSGFQVNWEVLQIIGFNTAIFCLIAATIWTSVIGLGQRVFSIVTFIGLLFATGPLNLFFDGKFHLYASAPSRDLVLFFCFAYGLILVSLLLALVAFAVGLRVVRAIGSPPLETAKDQQPSRSKVGICVDFEDLE